MEEKESKSADIQVRSIVRWMRRKLEKAGVYDDTLSYQIELVAGDMLIYRKLRRACLQEDGVTYTEKSREGDDRIKISPVLSELRRQSKIVSDGLDRLTMNIKSKRDKVETQDALADFLTAVQDD